VGKGRGTSSRRRIPRQRRPVRCRGPRGDLLPAAVFLAAVRLLKASIYLLIGAVFIQAILSWVKPYNAAAPVLDSLTRPFMRPIQRLIPPISGIDLSPLALFIACELVLMVPVALLEGLASRLL